MHEDADIRLGPGVAITGPIRRPGGRPMSNGWWGTVADERADLREPLLPRCFEALVGPGVRGGREDKWGTHGAPVPRGPGGDRGAGDADVKSFGFGRRTFELHRHIRQRWRNNRKRGCDGNERMGGKPPETQTTDEGGKASPEAAFGSLRCGRENSPASLGTSRAEGGHRYTEGYIQID